MRFLFLGLVALLIASCNHSHRKYEDFSRIKLGMVKSEVIEVAGPPHWSDRWDGLDRWFYYMKPEDKQTEQVVYFREGNVFHKGSKIKPLLTAEEEDELKKPRPKKNETAFKPTFNEKELRKVLQKEVDEAEKHKKKPKFEQIN